MIQLTKSKPHVFAALFFLCLTGYLCLSALLMNGPDFNDETEKLVAAMLIFEGKRLYGEIFVQHGPVAYMLSHLLYVLVPLQDIAVQRIIPVMLTLASVLALMMSPLLKAWRSRFLAGSAMLVGLMAIQSSYGLVMAMYQVYAGLFFSSALTLFVGPFIYGGEVSRWRAVVGGACLALVFLCAFSFSIAIAMCVLACSVRLYFEKSCWRPLLKKLAEASLGAIFAASAVLLWMVFFADLKGYIFAHFYFNLTAYKAYMGEVSPFDALALLVPGRAFWILVQTSAQALKEGSPSASTAWFTHLIFAFPPLIFLGYVATRQYRMADFGRTSKKILLAILLLLAIVWMNPRFSLNVGAATYIIVSISSFAMGLGLLLEEEGRGWVPQWGGLGAFCLLLFAGLLAQVTTRTYLYGVSPFQYYFLGGVIRPEHSAGMERLREVLKGDLHAQQFPFDLTFYTKAGVTPSSGTFYWMPWMNEYAKHPIGGHRLDLCEEMNERPPKAISYSEERASIWGVSPDAYLSCFKDLLVRKYVAVPSIPSVWLRADVLAKQEDLLKTAVISPTLDISWLGERERSVFLDIRRSSRALTPPSGCASPIRNPTSAPADVESCDDTLVLRNSMIVSSETGQCLEITGASTSAGAQARYWPCTGSSNQLFEALPVDGGFRLRNQFSGLCLSATTDKLKQQGCNAGRVWPSSPGSSN